MGIGLSWVPKLLQSLQNEAIWTSPILNGQWSKSFHSLYLSEHFWEVIDVGGAQGLRLETLRLQQVLGDIRSVDEHAMQRTLLVSICLEHDLKPKETGVTLQICNLQHPPRNNEALEQGDDHVDGFSPKAKTRSMSKWQAKRGKPRAYAL